MNVLPPGTLLQLMYLSERLKRITPGRFLEIGPGTGEISSLLLRLGWTGVSFDLEPKTIERLSQRFNREIRKGLYMAINKDFFSVQTTSLTNFDLIISCMVMEHLPGDLEARFLDHSRHLLCESGLMIGLVPSSPAHWGIEDEIAGHCRRYTRGSLKALANACKWNIRHIAGLTYPISNILLPISNRIVRRAESSKLNLSDYEKTKASGARDVPFKTRFPNALGFVLNKYTMYPLYLLQNVYIRSPNALVLYFELEAQ